MLQHDIDQLQNPLFMPDGSNTVYIIFMIIGIVGYFTVPTVASWIIQGGGAGAYGQKVNTGFNTVGSTIAGAAGGAVGNAGGRLMRKGK